MFTGKFILSLLSMSMIWFYPTDVGGQTAGTGPGANQAAAIIDGKREITLEEVDRALGQRLYPLREKIYALRRQSLEDLITGVVLEKKAASLGMTIERLRASMIPAEVEVSRDELDRAYAENSEILSSLGEIEAREKIRQDLISRKKMAAFRRSLEALLDQSEIRVLLEPPDPPVFEIRMHGPALGEESAPVTLAVFSDFQCPYCRQAAGEVRKLVEAYPSMIRVIHKNLPLPIHPQALAAAVASHCAAQAGRFWEYHDRLFSAQGLSREELVSYAVELGMDREKMLSCLDSERARRAVEDDLNEARKLKLQGTPTIFINGKLFSGNPTFGNLKKAIDRELTPSGSNTR